MKPIRNLCKKAHTWNIVSDTSGQMIVIMGVLIVISVVLLGSLAAEIADIDVIVSNERSSSLLAEYIIFEEAFGSSLQVNLTNITIMDVTTAAWSYRTLLYGNASNITQSFNNTRNRFYILALRYDMIFDATLKKSWYSHPANNGDIYYVDTTIYVSDGISSITRDVTYTLVVRPYINY